MTLKVEEESLVSITGKEAHLIKIIRSVVNADITIKKQNNSFTIVIVSNKIKLHEDPAKHTKFKML